MILFVRLECTHCEMKSAHAIKRILSVQSEIENINKKINT